MSKVAVSGNASGTGVFTIASPNSNSDRVLTLPDATGTVLVSGQPVTATTGSFSGDVTLGSSVLATPTGSAPSYTCRAWVNFNGTGTVAIRASGNVSSITDNGTGQYTVNFTTAMPDANYATSATARNTSTGAVVAEAPGTSMTTTGFNTFTFKTNTTSGTDADYVSIAVFR